MNNGHTNVLLIEDTPVTPTWFACACRGNSLVNVCWVSRLADGLASLTKQSAFRRAA